MTREQHAYHGIPNEIVAAWLIESIYAADKLAQARRPAAITLPMASGKYVRTVKVDLAAVTSLDGVALVAA